MPELPEVETVRSGLAKLLPGKVISGVDIGWHKSFQATQHEVNQFVAKARVQAIKRRAKVLLIELASNYTLVIHLKMTGQLVYVADSVRWGAGHPNDSLISNLPDKSTRVTFTFSNKSKLFFNDQRKFGWIKLVPTLEVENIDFFKKIGPEPLSSNFTAGEFVDRVQRRKNTSIKAVLLDQTVISGVGNIYADEALFEAHIHPATKVISLNQTQLHKLFKGVQHVLRMGIKHGGSTDKNYVNAEGKKGSYLTFAKVFRREGKPCYNCETTIEKIKVAGRGTHICPHCQHESSRK